MKNFLLKNLNELIKNLESKLLITSDLKSKVGLLEEISTLKTQVQSLLEIEQKKLQDRYEAITADKIKDIHRSISKAESRGKFMKDYTYNLDKEVLLINTDYTKFVDSFWLDIISNLDPDVKVMAKFLIQLSDTSARTLCKTEIVSNNPGSLKSFKEVLNENLNNVYSHYLNSEEDNLITGFIMRYKILSSVSKAADTAVKKAEDIKKGRIQRTVKIRNINYPLSTNSTDFGDVQFQENGKTYVLDNSKGLKYEFERSDNGQTINVFKEDVFITTINDSFIDLDNNLFKRTLNNISYYIKKGVVILRSKEYKPKFIKKAKCDSICSDNFYTADIETLTKLDAEGKRYFEPYAIARYDGMKATSYYVSDYNNWEEMVYIFWKDIFDLELKKTDIYFHNLSGFDVNFILKPILNMENVFSEIMLRDDKFIQISLRKGETSFNIKDSLLLLPGSLNNLSKSFKIETPKEVFPRKLFESETFPADYISLGVPAYKYFNSSEVSLEAYREYCNQFKFKSWSLKDETLKYVDIDCIALHQILSKFSDTIFNMWSIDIKHTPTLPSLCFKIYKVRYMPKEKIPIITGIPYRDIKQAYTGGSTDMYIPYGENVWCYDINSLYPAAMLKYKYPVGNYTSFENLGNLSISDFENVLQKEIFGFVEVEVNCPENITHPILQIRREVKGNLRTFAPCGTFKGWFHSEEIKEAMKLGYKFKIISGYLFEEEDIFSEYVNDLYKIKMEADKNKDQIWRLISKNLMNSLYGRFGMDQTLSNNIVIDKDDALLETLIEKVEIEDVVELDNKLLVQYLPKGYNTMSYQENLEIDISVAIAASVTAFARIKMAGFKNNPNYNLLYTDTDSLYVTFKSEADRISFDKEFVDPLKLGYLKIENPIIEGKFVPFERFYFLGPKFYVGILNGEIDFSKTKIRGLQKAYRTMIDENSVKSLLNYNRKPIQIETMKWYKNLSDSRIYIKKVPYNLDIANFKRSLIYNYYNKDKIVLEKTSSIEMKDNKIYSFGNFNLKDNYLYEELSNLNTPSKRDLI